MPKTPFWEDSPKFLGIAPPRSSVGGEQKALSAVETTERCVQSTVEITIKDRDKFAAHRCKRCDDNNKQRYRNGSRKGHQCLDKVSVLERYFGNIRPLFFEFLAYPGLFELNHYKRSGKIWKRRNFPKRARAVTLIVCTV